MAKQIKDLAIIAQEKVASFLSGNRRSLYRGEGTDFADLREYIPGDDLRRIDWRASAKTRGNLIVKEFDLERNTDVMILLDLSASMLLGGREQRIKLAVEAVASLTHATVQNKDNVGFGAFSEDMKKFIPPKGGRSHEYFIYKQLLELIPKGSTEIGVALKEVATALRRRSLILVVTDLHDAIDKTLEGFRIAKAFNHEVQLLQVTDTGEFSLPSNIGKVKYLDPETRKPLTVDLSDLETKGVYLYNIYQKIKEIEKFKRKLRGLGVRVVEAHTDELIEQVLITYYSSKKRAY